MDEIPTEDASDSDLMKLFAEAITPAPVPATLVHPGRLTKEMLDRVRQEMKTVTYRMSECICPFHSRHIYTPCAYPRCQEDPDG